MVGVHTHDAFRIANLVTDNRDYIETRLFVLIRQKLFGSQ